VGRDGTKGIGVPWDCGTNGMMIERKVAGLTSGRVEDKKMLRMMSELSSVV
jgi:hypothetical protein